MDTCNNTCTLGTGQYEVEVALTLTGSVHVDGETEEDARQMALARLEDCHPFDELELIPTNAEVRSLKWGMERDDGE